MSTLSVVISAFNEEKKIKDCLESVKDLATEIIFVDNTSSDDTPEIAKKYTDKIFIRKNNMMLNVNKNFGFEKASGDWILSLDADERVTDELRTEINEVIESEHSVNGYLIPRKNILFGKWVKNSIWWPDYQLRLFKKNSGKFPEKHVHELIEVEGSAEKLENPLLHYNYETVNQYLYKLDRIYTENEVERILSSGKKLSWHDAVSMPVHDFLKTYLLQKGYKDGLHGLVLSMLQAFYAEIVFAKVWEKQGFDESSISLSSIYKEFSKLGLEFEYWFLTAFLEEAAPHKKILLKLKRKLINKKIKS
jgi:glycosyltransferase involved in cell wall biosynthesis